jgi:hypothetical protein
LSRVVVERALEGGPAASFGGQKFAERVAAAVSRHSGERTGRAGNNPDDMNNAEAASTPFIILRRRSMYRSTAKGEVSPTGSAGLTLRDKAGVIACRFAADAIRTGQGSERVNSDASMLYVIDDK